MHPVRCRQRRYRPVGCRPCRPCRPSPGAVCGRWRPRAVDGESCSAQSPNIAAPHHRRQILVPNRVGPYIIRRGRRTTRTDSTGRRVTSRVQHWPWAPPTRRFPACAFISTPRSVRDTTAATPWHRNCSTSTTTARPCSVTTATCRPPIKSPHRPPICHCHPRATPGFHTQFRVRQRWCALLPQILKNCL